VRPCALTGTVISERNPTARRISRCSESRATAASTASGTSGISSGSPVRSTLAAPAGSSARIG
jgi:hypothetical protein